MKTDLTIPQEIKEATVDAIVISIVEKSATVNVLIPGKPRKSVTVDLTDKIAAVTVTQRTTVKNFLKYIVAQAFGVEETILPDTIFEPDEVDNPSV